MGKFSSLKFSYLKIALMPCTGTGCKNASEIDAYLFNKKFSFIFTDYYFNLDEPNPVNMYVNDMNFFTLTPNSEYYANFFIQKSQLERSYLYKDYSEDLY